MMPAARRIGLISDTHGLVRPEAVAFLRGSALIVHAGDICEPGVLRQLEAIAPVVAVRGNNDHGAWAARLNQSEAIEADALALYVLHDIGALELDPAVAGFRVVVSGHSHRPSIERRDGVLYVNPGSAGPRRFRLPVSVGELIVRDAEVEPRLVELSVGR